MSSVSVVIPTHPERLANGLLDRAVKSVWAQERLPNNLIVSVDTEKHGAALTRHKGLTQVQTEWVAFLDSDDEFLPFHLSNCLRTAEETGADYVYPWFVTWGGSDPFPEFYKKPWDNAAPHHTTIVTVVRTELAKNVGFLDYERPVGGSETKVSDEDWRFTLGCLNAGAKIIHHPEKTWMWHHHGANTSGQPNQGDAIPPVPSGIEGEIWI